MHKLTEDILDSVQVGALATVNRDRTPLVTPLHFARCENDIIWVSDREARHSHNVFRMGCAEFVVWDEAEHAVFLTATARELQDEVEITTAKAAYAAKFGEFMPGVLTPRFYAMPIGQLDEKTTTKRWLHYVA